MLYLLDVYAKSAKEDLTDAEKREIRTNAENTIVPSAPSAPQTMLTQKPACYEA